jgi:hypothetical protein
VLSYFPARTEKFTPEEEAETELMLWEYDRDGQIAIENVFRREPELSLRMARHTQEDSTRSK